MNYLPRVVSGFNPVIVLATSIGSTFARLHTEAKSWRGWFHKKGILHSHKHIYQSKSFKNNQQRKKMRHSLMLP